MGKLRELQKNANLLAKNWGKIRDKVLEESRNDVLEFIAEDQLFDKGIDGEGTKLLGYKHEKYRKFKASLNPNRVTDLQVTGDFLRNFFVFMKGDNLFTGSSDWKSRKLHSQYGRQILSLTDENTKIFAREDVLPVLQDLTKQALKL